MSSSENSLPKRTTLGQGGYFLFPWRYTQVKINDGDDGDVREVKQVQLDMLRTGMLETADWKFDDTEKPGLWYTIRNYKGRDWWIAAVGLMCILLWILCTIKAVANGPGIVSKLPEYARDVAQMKFGQPVAVLLVVVAGPIPIAQEVLLILTAYAWNSMWQTVAIGGIGELISQSPWIIKGLYRIVRSRSDEAKQSEAREWWGPGPRLGEKPANGLLFRYAVRNGAFWLLPVAQLSLLPSGACFHLLRKARVTVMGIVWWWMWGFGRHAIMGHMGVGLVSQASNPSSSSLGDGLSTTVKSVNTTDILGSRSLNNTMASISNTTNNAVSGFQKGTPTSQSINYILIGLLSVMSLIFLGMLHMGMKRGRLACYKEFR